MAAGRCRAPGVPPHRPRIPSLELRKSSIRDGPPFDRNKIWRRGRASLQSLYRLRVFDLVIFYLDFQSLYCPDIKPGKPRTSAELHRTVFRKVDLSFCGCVLVTSLLQ